MMMRKTPLLALALVLALQNAALAGDEDCLAIYNQYRVTNTEESGDPMGQPVNVPLHNEEIAGQPFTVTMDKVIGPIMDYQYRNGEQVVTGEVARERFHLLGRKLKARVDAMFTEEQLVFLIDEMHALGKLRADDFAAAISKIVRANPDMFPKRVDQFKAAPVIGFIASASLSVEVVNGEVTYHFGYADNVSNKGVQKGRSAIIDDEGLDDPSDDKHLADMQELFSNPKNRAEALKVIKVMDYFHLTSVAKGIEELSPLGKRVVLTYIAVGIAEARRNRLDGKLFTNPWDIALDLTTEWQLIFESGLPQTPGDIWIMFEDEFWGINEPVYTNKVPNQYPDNKGRLVIRYTKGAQDYTQRGDSPGTDAFKRTNRSGPNMTKKAQLKMTGLLHEWMYTNYRHLHDEVVEATGLKGENLFYEWAVLVWSRKLETMPEEQIERIVEARHAYNAVLQKNAKKIHEWIKTQVPVGLPEIRFEGGVVDQTKPAKPKAKVEPQRRAPRVTVTGRRR